MSTWADIDEAPAITVGGLAITDGVARMDYAENEAWRAWWQRTRPPTAGCGVAMAIVWSLGGDDAGDFRIGNQQQRCAHLQEFA